MSESANFEIVTRLFGTAWVAPLTRAMSELPYPPSERTVYRWKARGKLPESVQAWLRRRETEGAGKPFPGSATEGRGGERRGRGKADYTPSLSSDIPRERTPHA